MSYDLLKLKNQICHRFYIASNGITRLYRPLLNELDVTYPQYLVLMALWEEDKVTISSIVDQTHIDGGSLTLILNKLKQKNIIEYLKDKQDRRSKIVKLTLKGEKLKEKAKEIPLKVACQLPKLTNSEMKSLYTLLDKINAQFKED